MYRLIDCLMKSKVVCHLHDMYLKSTYKRSAKCEISTNACCAVNCRFHKVKIERENDEFVFRLCEKKKDCA